MVNIKHLTILCVCFLLPAGLLADALVVTRAMNASTVAEIYIEKDHIRTEMEIGWPDLSGFRNLLPSKMYQSWNYGTEPLEERLKTFFAEDFIIQGDGQILPAAVRLMEIRKRVVRDEITGEPIASKDAEDVLYVEMIHALEERPKQLSFAPPEDDTQRSSVSIGMQVYHQGLPVNDFRYLGREEVLNLDWDDPWYSHFENKNLWRQYNESINAFLYIEPYEVRVEVVVRPKDIQQWMDLGLHGLETIPVDLQAGLKDKIAVFLLTQMTLEVDGNAVQPKLERMSFLKRTLRSSIVIDPPEELDAISATLGVIYSVPIEALPQSANLTWNLFSPKMQVVRSAATDEAGPMPYKLMPDDNVLTWNNYLKNPTIPGVNPLDIPDAQRQISVSIGTPVTVIILIPLAVILYRKKGRVAAMVGMVVFFGIALFAMPILPRVTLPIPGKALWTEEEKQDLVSGLLGNVYASFDFNGESAVYDALNQSLAGDLLSRVYLETMKSLELKSQGGARVKVKGVSLIDAEFEDAGEGYSVICDWDVRGSVGHWGHVHERVNRYSAELNIEPVDGEWKITHLDILEELRVK